MDSYVAAADAYGVAGGGGFMNPQQQQGAGFRGSPARPRADPRRKAVTPITVKLLMTSRPSKTDDGVFEIHGQEINQVTMVGRVTDVQMGEAVRTYVLDDCTGKVEVKYWMSGDPDALRGVVVGSYIRVTGNIKEFQDQKSLQAFSVLHCESHNEITFHVLDVIHAHLVATRGHPGAGASLGLSAAFRPGGGGGAAGGVGLGGGGYYQGVQMSPLQTMIIEIVKKCTDRRGMSIDELSSQLAGKAVVSQIKEAINTLTNEGFLYSTHDDSHFLATDM